MNSVRWMAPELINTSPRYSIKSDMYALGMVMWEMAANCTTPFRHKTDDTSVKELPPDVPDEYRKWIEYCWEHNPEKRPEAHEIAKEINEPPHEIAEEANKPPHEISEKVVVKTRKYSMIISQNPSSCDFVRILEFIQELKPKVQALFRICQDLAEHCDKSFSLAQTATLNDHDIDENRCLYDALKCVAKLLLSMSPSFYIWKHSSTLETQITTAWSDVTEAAKVILGTDGGVFVDEASLQETRFGHLGDLIIDWNTDEVFTAKRVGNIKNTTIDETIKRAKAISHWMRSCEGIMQVNKIQYPDLIIYGSEKAIPLDQYLKKHKLSPRDKWGLALKIACTLSFVHEYKIVHRDIRAANVFMVEEGGLEPKLAGFEICHSDKRLYIGTPEIGDVWIAPEIRRGHNTSFKTDVFSFGVLMYEIARGQPPEWNDILSWSYNKVEQNVKWTEECFPFVPSLEYSELMQQCLSMDDERRPTMPEVFTKLLDGYFGITIQN
ncbi:hypothetical protein BGW42_008701 [Actinomortierella wolfii]|nr:hypothetical protein BGW42_008701 [Actinomortierella wolfii]